jgi:hypothetical protein
MNSKYQILNWPVLGVQKAWSRRHQLKLGVLPLKPLHQPCFVEGFFQDRISWTIYLGWLWTVILLISASCVARLTDVSHWHPAALVILKFIFYFGGTVVWTWGFVLAKQALYHLNHTSSPFCFGYFWRWGLIALADLKPQSSGSSLSGSQAETPLPGLVIS